MKQNTLCFVVAVLAVAVGSVVALSAVYMRIVGDKSRLHSSYERRCQEKKILPAPREDAGVVTCI